MIYPCRILFHSPFENFLNLANEVVTKLGGLLPDWSDFIYAFTVNGWGFPPECIS